MVRILGGGFFGKEEVGRREKGVPPCIVAILPVSRSPALPWASLVIPFNPLTPVHCSNQCAIYFASMQIQIQIQIARFSITVQFKIINFQPTKISQI